MTITISGIASRQHGLHMWEKPYGHYFGRCLPEDNFRTLMYVFGRDPCNHHNHVYDPS